jgi:hypothetical protein
MELDQFTEQLCKSDFKYFVKLILGLKTCRMHEEMIDALVNSDKHVVAMAPRGHGKTLITSVAFPIWQSWRVDKPILIVIMSATLDQSVEILEQIKQYVTRIDILYRELYPDNIHETQWSATKLKFKNGCRIICSPFGSSIRGKHPNFAILDDILKDEAANVEYARETFYSAVFPIVQAKKGKFLVVGTPMNYVDLLNDLMKPEKERDWTQLRYRACEEDYDGNLSNPLFPELFPLYQLEKIKRTQPPHLWSREYLCEPISGDMSLFPYKLIEQCENLELEESSEDVQYYMGCDIALSDKAGSDYSAYAVVKKQGNNLSLVHLWREKGVSTTGQMEQIKKMNKEWRFSKILIEKVGLSIGLVDELQEDLEVRNVVQPFVTKRVNKEQILSHLEVIMRNKGIKLGKFSGLETLRKELMSFKYRVRQGKQTYESVGAHDDTVIAFALAVEAATGSLGIPSISWVSDDTTDKFINEDDHIDISDKGNLFVV